MSDHSRLRLRVLELASGISGPYCGRVLAGFGARVVKVEPPVARGQDRARNVGPFKDDIPGPDRSGLFAYLNGNKLGITLDYESADGLTILKRLVEQQDLVILDGPADPNTPLHRHMLDWNPSLITVSISPFGEDGPYRDLSWSELILQALGGIVGRTGLADREPLRSGAELAQFIAGANAVSVALAAMFRSKVSGKGCHIELSTYEAVVQFLQGTLMKWSFERTIVRRGAQTRAANAIYPCADGYIGIFAPGSGTAWRNAAAVMEEPRLAEERFKTRASRAQHVDELDALILPWTLEHAKDDIYHRSQAAGLPFGPVRNAADFLASKHHRERGFIRAVEHPVIGPYEAPGMPFRVDGLSWHDEPAPGQGQHTEVVLKTELGLSEEQVSALVKAGVV